MLIDAQGWACVLERRPNTLLGTRSNAWRNDHELLLEAGSTLLLYTDGLIERRHELIDEGIERLRAVAARVAHLPVDAMCDALLTELTGPAHDDIAVLALRIGT